MPAADAEADLVLHDRAAHRDPDFVARIAMPRLRKFRPGKDLEIGEVRLRGDVADGAAFRTGAEQRALRTAQHLDPLEVEDRGQRIAGAETERAHLDRRVDAIAPGRPAARAPRKHAEDRKNTRLQHS